MEQRASKRLHNFQLLFFSVTLDLSSAAGWKTLSPLKLLRSRFPLCCRLNQNSSLKWSNTGSSTESGCRLHSSTERMSKARNRHTFVCFYYVKWEVDALADLLVDAGEDEALGCHICLSCQSPASMTEDSFPFLCLAQGCYFLLAGQFFIFSANATLCTVSIYSSRLPVKGASNQASSQWK